MGKPEEYEPDPKPEAVNAAIQAIDDSGSRLGYVENMLGMISGKTVEELELSDDQSVLWFSFSDGSSIGLEAKAGCVSCADAWWNDGIGVKELIGGKINEVFAAQLHQDEETDDIYYGIELKTSRGVSSFVFRSTSTYYGAEVEEFTAEDRNRMEWIKWLRVTCDWCN